MPTKNLPSFLKNPETRASHLAILVIVSIIFILALVLLPWAIFRSGGVLSSKNEEAVAVSTTTTRDSTDSGYKAMGNQLVDPLTNPGMHWIANGQSITSDDGTMELRLTNTGNLELWDYKTNRMLYESKTTNVSSPAQRFLVGVEGYCYLLRNDGSRSTLSSDSTKFWQSPNQFPPFFINEITKKSFFVQKGFRLEFYSDGLVLYSTNPNNTNITGTKQYLIPIWWQSRSGQCPPGVLTNWCSSATVPPSTCAC